MSNEQQKIASFEDACEAVAKKYGYDSWAALWLKRDQSYIKEAAELYAESKAREAWDRAAFDFNYGLNTAIRKIKHS